MLCRWFAHDLLALARSTQAATREVGEWEQWARHLGWVLVLWDRQGAAAAYDELQPLLWQQPAAVTDDEAVFWGQVAALLGRLRQAACLALQEGIPALQTDFDAGVLAAPPASDAVLESIIARATAMRDTAAAYLADEQPATSNPDSAANPVAPPSVQQVIDQFTTLIAELQEKRASTYYEGLISPLTTLSKDLETALGPLADTAPLDRSATISQDSTPSVYAQVLGQLQAAAARLEQAVKPILGELASLTTAAETRMAYYQTLGMADSVTQPLLTQIQETAAGMRKSYANAAQLLHDQETALVARQGILETERQKALDDAKAALVAAEGARDVERRRWEAEQRQALIADYHSIIAAHHQAYAAALANNEPDRASGLLQRQLTAYNDLRALHGLDVIEHTFTVLLNLLKVRFPEPDSDTDRVAAIADPPPDPAAAAPQGSMPDFSVTTVITPSPAAEIPTQHTLLTKADVLRVIDLIMQQRAILQIREERAGFLQEAEGLWWNHETLVTQRPTLNNDLDGIAANLTSDHKVLADLNSLGAKHGFTGYDAVNQFTKLQHDLEAQQQQINQQLAQRKQKQQQQQDTQARSDQTLGRVSDLMSRASKVREFDSSDEGFTIR
ncbi:MAG: hypothetical protein M3Z04_16275 [Chloroflexota bacterium]|nr:hypothetical protein [Chloroflexota bacterium]